MTTDFLRINPSKFYENPADGITVVTPAGNIYAVGNNQQIVAAVSGKRIRIMGILFQSDAGAQASFYLKSASGGTFLGGPHIAPPSTIAPMLLPVVNSGYYETNTGEGLFIDVGANALRITVFYVLYTP